MTSVLTRLFGVSAFMIVAGVLAVVFLVFTLVRLRLREQPEPDPAADAAVDPGLDLSDPPLR
ncbi:MAG: hypothetical protein VX152_07260 [Pseudomonadota bacterium]|nr:hypothetical protein [Pseudomonadota bacterium]